MSGTIPEYLQRMQAQWLEEWQKYMIRENANDARTVVEIGCGCGYIMSNLNSLLDVTGIDSDPDSVECARRRGFKAILAKGENIPFRDDHFDIAYGNYLLMWNKNPKGIIKEMFRVAKKYVIFFAEPYWKGAVYSPSWIGEIVENTRKMIKERGGDPDMGIKLPSLVKEFTDDFMVGTIPLYTTHREMEKMVEFEVNFLKNEGYAIEKKDVEIFYLPTFWVIAKKSGR